MDKNMEIIAALKLCAIPGDAVCLECPYKDKSDDGMTCRSRVCQDAAYALAGATKRVKIKNDQIEALANERTDLLNKLNDMQKKLAEKQTSVCSDAEGLKTDVIKLAEAVETFKREANYWHGQADALKWFIEFYHSSPDTTNDDAVEVPDDV